MENKSLHKLGIDIGSTTVKVAVLDEQDNLLFSDYERHFANIQETLTSLIQKAFDQLGELSVAPMITGSGGLTLAKHLEVPFVQEVISVSTALQHYAPQTDVCGASDCRQSSESFRPPFSKGGAVEGAKPSSPSADGETLLSALSFCSFAKQSVLFSLRLHGQRKSVVQLCSFLDDNSFCLQPEIAESNPFRRSFYLSNPDLLPRARP